MSTPVYVTLAAMKTTLDLSGTAWDGDMTASIAAASRAIDGICDRRFYLDSAADQVRVYTPAEALLLEIDDLNELTTLKTDTTGDGAYDATWTAGTDFNLEPLNAQADSQDPWPFTRLRVRPYGSFMFNWFIPASVQVTGQFGWPTIPDAVVEGTALLTERLFKMKREAPLGVLAFQDVAMRIAKADSNLQIVVGRYMKHAVAVA